MLICAGEWNILLPGFLIPMKMAPVCILLVCIGIHIAKASILNVALRKPASMSSSMTPYRASTAVDGNTNAEGYGTDQIINTGTGQSFAWWKVDLQREVQDATVRIYFRTDYKTRRNGVKLYTSTSPFPTSNPTSQGQLCHNVTGDPSGSDIPDVYNVTCPGRWRYLLLYTDTDNDGFGPVLDFGEVEVYECSDETYGEDCAKTCSARNCVTMKTSCDRDGRCPGGCKSGWRGVDCTQECESGTYGDCSLFCNDRNCLVQSAECNHVTGQCEGGCQAGYQGKDCRQGCDLGVNYGVNCINSCNDRHCNQPSECDTKTGQCIDGCQVGWTGGDCTSRCDLGVNYGVNCRKSCTDRHCNQPSECDTRTGQCTDGCQVGWTGGDCISRCPSGTYGSNCTEKCGECDGVCDRGSGICYEGCLDGYRGAWCNVTTDAANNNIVVVVGSVLGTLLLVVVLVVVGVLVLLFRHGRLQWVKKPDQMSHDNTELKTVVPQSNDASEQERNGGHVNTNYYNALDPQLTAGNMDYDVIQHKEYQNV